MERNVDATCGEPVVDCQTTDEGTRHRQIHVDDLAAGIAAEVVMRIDARVVAGRPAGHQHLANVALGDEHFEIPVDGPERHLRPAGPHCARLLPDRRETLVDLGRGRMDVGRPQPAENPVTLDGAMSARGNGRLGGSSRHHRTIGASERGWPADSRNFPDFLPRTRSRDGRRASTTSLRAGCRDRGRVVAADSFGDATRKFRAGRRRGLHDGELTIGRARSLTGPRRAVLEADLAAGAELRTRPDHHGDQERDSDQHSDEDSHQESHLSNLGGATSALEDPRTRTNARLRVPPMP
jgi:hypothetical protein